MKAFITLVVLFLSVSVNAENVSGLDKESFKKYWRIESESKEYKVQFTGDTVDIVAPKGLTLWRKDKMSGKVTIEYDACVVNGGKDGRLSDLNCFWMASDPHASTIWKRLNWRNGNFNKCYSLQMYYMGYGGNYNSTTRFRRYDGNEAGITDAAQRPKILFEYKNRENLLEGNRWYHIKITNENNKVCYYIDGKRLVDFRDSNPLTEGWFGFRTTLSHVKLTNFRYTSTPLNSNTVPLHWVGQVPTQPKAVNFGVPFNQGELSAGTALKLFNGDRTEIPADTWPLAYWPDGSVKWAAVASVVPSGADKLTLEKVTKKSKKQSIGNKILVDVNDQMIKVSNGVMTAYIPKNGQALMDSISLKGSKVAGKAYLVCRTQNQIATEATSSITFKNYTSELTSVEVEKTSPLRAVIKINGVHKHQSGESLLPFLIRLYFHYDSPEIKMVHSLVYDGDMNKDFINSLGVRFEVPMREALYNRHVAFSCADGGVWSEPVQPLIGRKVLSIGKQTKSKDPALQRKQMAGERIPEYSEFDAKNQALIDDWASWDNYRLSQLSADAFSIRKRANVNNPWIGTFSGSRSSGFAFAGDLTGGLSICLHDFWQSYPSSIEISNARTSEATLTAWLWSPEAEPMDLRHYDNRAHGLISSYEDVQEGMSTPYGIARTTTLSILPQEGYKGKADFAERAENCSALSRLLPTPEYLHAKRAFGVWSLPDYSNEFRANIEKRLNDYIHIYQNSIEEQKWYGFWNYGDVMHAYDPVRHTWRYDVGGYAWDNTELASNMWLWYNFLRTGDAKIWRMAEAMTRHTTEVDVYHIGEHAGLGSRHNVNHWGCGAKEARISQATWNRFYYYLTTDERAGDLMAEVKDADLKLYTLDPMRLAQPRNQYPCTAPARLRIGPDWVAYAANWMTEWERTQNTYYRDKIKAGMKSLVNLPSRLFTGPMALGYDPKTGVITSECDPKLQSVNHLMAIMGGFEIMNEMNVMMQYPEWNDAWLDLAMNYKKKSLQLTHSYYRISRFMGYASYYTYDNAYAEEAWKDMFIISDQHKVAPPFTISTILPPEVPAPMTESPSITTNDAAIWSLDAIYLQEVAPKRDKF